LHFYLQCRFQKKEEVTLRGNLGFPWFGDDLAAKKNKTGAPEVSLPGKNEREINVLKHELVPAHRILADGERENLLEKFNIVAKQLPKILSADPVVKAADAKVGDVLEITRKSLSAGVAVYYRLVVA